MKTPKIIATAATALLLLVGSAHSSTIPGGNFSGDQSYGPGTHYVTGVVYIVSGGSMSFPSNCTIKFYSGAGFVVQSGDLSFGSTAGVQTVLERYNAAYSWSGIRNTGGTLNLQNVKIDGAANTYGGGIYVSGGTNDFDEIEVVNCSATYKGGGAYVTTSVTFNDCSFTDNSASSGGGGVAVYGTSGHLTLNDCVIADNTSTNYSGGVYSYNGDLTMDHCIVAGNYGSYGSIYIEGDFDPDFTLDYCTVYGNEVSGGNAGGIEIYDYTNATVSNSIIWGNENSEISTWWSGATSVTYSCVEGGYTGTGNTAHYPGLLNTATLGFNLDGNSPCIDSADPSDSDDPDGTDPDMGAVYRPQTTLSGTISGTYNSGALYRVTDALYVDENTSLTVSGATDFLFADNVHLVVAGTLTIQGTATDTVQFCGAGSGDWQGIFIYDPTGTTTISYAGIRDGDADDSEGYSDNGGGLYIEGAEVDIDHTVFEHNTAVRAGGGIFITGGDCNVDIDYCRIQYNAVTTSASTGGGGGVMIQYGTPTISMTYTDVSLNDITAIAYDKDAGAGVDMFCTATNITLDNCTIAYNKGNPSGWYQGGIFITDGTPYIVDCIVWGNEPAQFQLSTPTTYYTDVEDGAYDDDPVFANVSAGDFHLTVGSPSTVKTGSSTSSYMGAYGVAAKLSRDVASRALPTALSLSQNAPNPFNPSTTIQFALPSDGHVNLVVYSLTGQIVAELADTELHAGYHEVVWNGLDANGRSVASGVYVYRLVTEQGEMAKRMTLLR